MNQPIRLGLDTETDLIVDGATPDLVCVGYATAGGSGLEDRQGGLDLTRAVLADQDLEVVTHNGSFDFGVLCRADPALYPAVFEAYEQGRIVDTMIWAQVDDIARGCYFGTRKGRYGLGDLSEGILSKPLDKGEDTWRLKYGELKGVPIASWPEQARAYAQLDPERTLEIANNMHEPPDMRRQSAHAFWLYLMSAEGMITDQPRVEALLSQTVDEAAGICKDLRAAGLIRFDPDGMHRNVKQVQKRIFEFLGDSAPKTPKGGIQTSAEACEATKDPLLLRYARLGELLDIINKDSEYLTQPIVRCSYGLAETGRSTSWGPNMQNLKKDGGIRECFIPPPGYVYAGADFSGLELATLAQVCLQLVGYSKLADALREGKDPHCIIAGEILSCGYAEAVTRCKDKQDKEAYNARQTGKVFNFGAGGGGGPKAMAAYGWQNYRVELSLHRAAQIKQLWYTLFPEMREYHAMIGQMGDPITQLYSGRIRYCGGIYTEKANGFFQGLGGDATKAAGFALAKACYATPSSVLYGSRPVNYEHDAFLTCVPEERGHECAIEQSRIMVEAAQQFIPDIPLKAEPYLARRHSKYAEDLWVDSRGNPCKAGEGRLIPWDLPLKGAA